MTTIEQLKKLNKPETIAATEHARLITAYFPNLEIWENDFKTRKGR